MSVFAEYKHGAIDKEEFNLAAREEAWREKTYETRRLQDEEPENEDEDNPENCLL